MPEQQLRSLLTDPKETFDVELKQWIDPATPEGIAKIARGCIALRNNNGGRLVIGFTDLVWRVSARFQFSKTGRAANPRWDC